MSSAQTQKIATGKYRPEIDGLRAFAVVAVIINHFNKDILPGGYLGVDIFFVISGYVITSSLYGRPSKDFKDFLSSFYERRIKRLVPALSVFVLITSIAICLFDPSPGTSLKTGLTSLFGLSNLYLLRQSTDYFAQSTELSVFTHTWSLGVEEQFYMLFPFLIWFSGFGRQTKDGARNLFLIVGSLTIASLIGFLYLYPKNQPAAYFLMPLRFWEMAAGCLIFIGFQKRAFIEQFLEKVPPFLVLALIVVVMYLPMSMAATSTIAVVVLSSILIACLKKQTAAFQVFTHQRVVYIGFISYSLYLWHWGVLSISRWTIGIHWWSVPLQIALMLGLAVASYRWVETPLRKGNWFGNRWMTLIVGGGAIISLSFINFFVSTFKIFSDGSTVASKLFSIANRIDYTFAQGWGAASNSKEAIMLAECHFGRPITSVDFDSCIGNLGHEKLHRQMIYVFGDSHAANYAFGIRKAFPGQVRMATAGWECGYIPKHMSDRINSSNMNCSDYVAFVDDFVNNVKAGDIIVVGNMWSGAVKKSNAQTQNIKDLASRINSAGAIFILLDDVPMITQNPFVYSKTWYRPFPSPGISKKEADNAQKGLDLLGHEITQESPLSHYMSLRKYLCDSETCPFKRNGKYMYINEGHISVEASEKLSKYIISFFNDNVPSVRLNGTFPMQITED